MTLSKIKLLQNKTRTKLTNKSKLVLLKHSENSCNALFRRASVKRGLSGRDLLRVRRLLINTAYKIKGCPRAFLRLYQNNVAIIKDEGKIFIAVATPHSNRIENL